MTGHSTIELELFTHRFEVLAEQMGDVLQRVAMSVNVKERHDFSCALLDAGGRLVANAPHIPVHLGALGLCVRRVAAALDLGPGDVAVTNHPGFGGSHLPDVTVVTPVYGEDGERLGYVANRAHHAEIGGVRPGSMPPAARTLAEEGVVLPPLHLVRAGESRFSDIERLLTTAPYPSRSVRENLADLEAAVAANRKGELRLLELASEHGADQVARRMHDLAATAAARMTEALAALPDGEFRAREALDDGTPLEVRLELHGGRATIDFTGTGAVHPGNLNATPAIVSSVVLYVLRLLLDRPLPLNEGLLEPVELLLPECLLNPRFDEDPGRCPAVVGGNVETSQRLVDTLLAALGICAASQGTMNNVLFGTSERASRGGGRGAGFGYYETLCGGSGAGPGWDGESAVHTHMTNTAITDPESLELRYPVRLEAFGIRRGSGGAGRWRGGDGVRRRFLFLEPLEVSILSQRRESGPYGGAGGEAGSPGAQRCLRADGTVEELGGVVAIDVEPGDRLEIETPGGGGWGSAASEVAVEEDE